MTYLHSKGYVFRNLSTHNILMGDNYDDPLKLINFHHTVRYKYGKDKLFR